MSDLVKHAFGLLWMDEPVKARKLLADALSIAERGDGIDIARKSKQKPRPLPPEIMKAVDTKSVLIGLLFGVCILLALGAASETKSDIGIGRYQITSPDSSSVCFVLDTKTGQVWRRYTKTNGTNYGSPAEWGK